MPFKGEPPQTIACAVCGKLRVIPHAWAKRCKTPTCSRQCNGVLRGREWAAHGHKGAAARKIFNPKFGADNPAWKGGVTYRRRRGNYVSVKYVRCPPELLAMSRRDGYVMEHRLVIALHIGRPLLRTEVVHHVDHNPLNNSLANLELWPCNRTHKLAEHGKYIDGCSNALRPKPA